MANISSLLEIIRTAHLGRDMRQALHDSIQAVNNDTETALGKSLTFTNATRKLSLKAKDGTVLSEAVIPGGGSGGGSVDSVNGVAPDENGNVQLTASDVGAMSSSATLNDISDVTLSSPSNGQVLGYDGSKWKNVSGGSGGGSGSNENLLLNPWFQVNSTGFSSGSRSSIGESTPFIDEWTGYFSQLSQSATAITRNSDGTLKLKTTYLSGYNNGAIGITQTLKTSYVGKSGTISVRFNDDTVVSKSMTISTGTTEIGTYDGITVSMYLTSQNLFRILFSTTTDGKEFTIKAIKLELGSTSTLSLDTAPNYNEDLMKLGYINEKSNRNLLDNPWFTVNQKGVTSGTFASSAKIFDRWKVDRSGGTSNQATWDLTNGILTFDARGLTGVPYFAEYFDNGLEVGKTYTMSIMYDDDTINSKTFVARSSGNEIGNYVNGVAPAWFFSSNLFMIRGSDNAYAKIKAVKLELGSQSTLAFDTAPDYTTELLKCQRYLQPINAYTVLSRSPRVATTWWGVWNLPVPFRTTPTLSVTSKELDLFTSSSYAEEMNPTINMTNSGNVINLVVQSTASGKEGSSATLMLTGGWLDAQL